jgi:uncharacterized membrane protein
MSKFGRFFDFKDNKGSIIAAGLTIVFIVIIVVGYYFLVLNAPPEGFSSMYILDEQKQTEAYPEFVIINENSTFNIWVGVENHLGQKQSYEIQQKLTKDPILSFPINEDPVNKFSKTLENQETWESLITTTISNPGNYSLIFELYLIEDSIPLGDNVEPDNFVLLNIEADHQSQD